MGTAICTIIAAIATAVAGAVCFRFTKNQQRREAEKDVKKAEAETEQEKAEMRQAIFDQQDEEVTKRLATLLVVFFLLLIFGFGCTTQKVEVKYVSADRRITSVTNVYGVACKAVPDLVFAEMTDKLIELEALKKEQKVEKRLGQ